MKTTYCVHCRKPLTIAEEAERFCERCNTETVPTEAPRKAA
jgi:hypothetical protein